MKTSPQDSDCDFYVIAYGQEAVLKRCLTLLTKSFSVKRIVLIDNNSPQSLEQVANQFQIGYRRLSTNQGYAGACNAAMEMFVSTKTKNVCVMNSDVFVDSSFARRLHQFLTSPTDPTLGMFQPFLYFDSAHKRVENVGISYFQSGLAFQAKKYSQRNLCNGACLFLTRPAIEFLLHVDGFVFEQSFWSYAEDVEVSLRLRSRGWKLVQIPNLSAIHAQSASFGRRSIVSLSLYARNLLWILLMTRSNQEILIAMPWIVIGQLRIFLQLLLRGRPDVYIDLVRQTYRKREALLHKRVHWKANQYIDISSSYQTGAFPLLWGNA